MEMAGFGVATHRKKIVTFWTETEAEERLALVAGDC